MQVHASKKSKKGDEERSEEFSRVYELPTEKDVDPSKVTSSIYKDGVLTIELPVADALGQQPQPQWSTLAQCYVTAVAKLGRLYADMFSISLLLFTLMLLLW